MVVSAPIRTCGSVYFLYHSFMSLTRDRFFEGSVSVGVWQMACKRVIKVGERVVKDLATSSVFFCLYLVLVSILISFPDTRSDSSHPTTDPQSGSESEPEPTEDEKKRS